MKISIITVVYNNAEVIKTAIDSVLSQTYANIEYIVVDGASTDGTIDIVNTYGTQITQFISEPDHGVYDAMNKGIKLATGDVVGFLNSDDMYIRDNVIEEIVQAFYQSKTQSVFADLVYVRATNLNKVIRYYDSSHCTPEKFAYGWMPAHPTFFCRRELYEIYGAFKTNYRIAADFELLLRLLAVHRISYTYLQMPIVKMRLGGLSTSFRSLYLNSFEQLRACRENGIRSTIFKILSKYPAKITGYRNQCLLPSI
ncbi:MAG: glycosyltransferase family 2 protein [Sulfurospirillum cavolei]|uniref:glycosyltransferase family 2 protein n=1 Tax=Sulfurospirillum cavolei TaxID=366522 RepID=UPI0005A612A2|nr:glycosyltransferase family 2 protein [Sulfurospirillum cavolei]MDY0264183.1 glycosyltransferase family 2 protein [Sulfurospirillum cavolei]